MFPDQDQSCFDISFIELNVAFGVSGCIQGKLINLKCPCFVEAAYYRQSVDWLQGVGDAAHIC